MVEQDGTPSPERFKESLTDVVYQVAVEAQESTELDRRNDLNDLRDMLLELYPESLLPTIKRLAEHSNYSCRSLASVLLLEVSRDDAGKVVDVWAKLLNDTNESVKLFTWEYLVHAVHDGVLDDHRGRELLAEAETAGAVGDYNPLEI